MATREIPTLSRETQLQATPIAEVASTVRHDAAMSNNLSAIGAEIAQSASNQMAVQLGYETGKNPKGDLGPPITDFDKTFAQSYHAQALATLSTEAHKLFTDSEIAMSRANRLSPELIERSNLQVKNGLKKLMDLAPTAIKGSLQQSFDSTLLRQNESYQKKMISQQREDQTDNLIEGLQLTAKQAYQLGATGDFKGAEKAVDVAKMMADSAKADHLVSPHTARVAEETTKQSYYNGKFQKLAIDARDQNKLPEFYKEYAKGPKDGMTQEEWFATGQSIKQHMDFLESLRSQSEYLEMAKFQNRLVANPTEVTVTELQSVMSNLSPINAQKVELEWNRARKKYEQLDMQSNALIEGWSNTEAFARADPKVKDKSFDTQVKNRITLAHNNGTQLTPAEAEAQVATEAAGPIPRMINLLNSKSSHRNPQEIEESIKAIDYIRAHDKGENLSGLSDQAIAMNKKYMALVRGGMPTQEAANNAHEEIYNQSNEQIHANKQKYAEVVRPQIKALGSLKFFGTITGIETSNLEEPQAFTEQAENLLENYFITTNGDLETAKEMVKDSINQTYGETYVNGKKQTTYLPLEKIIGLPQDGTAYIQEDILSQVDTHLKPIKDAYDKGESQFYWELEPRHAPENIKDLKLPALLHRGNWLAATYALPSEKDILGQKFLEFNLGTPMVAHKIWRDGVRETYPLIVKADPWLSKAPNAQGYTGKWDIVLGTKNGWKPIQLLNPGSGNLIYYKPDVEKIKLRYYEVVKGTR